MTTVRSKFKCESVNINEHSKVASLRAVYGTEGENADFTKFTPAGYVQIDINNDAPAYDFFVPGKEYYLDFSLVSAE
jgi:hypothetical protein